MSLKEKNMINTDQAWNNLCSKLEKDGLLTNEKSKTPKGINYHLTRVAAAILILIGSFTLWFINNKNDKRDFLSIQNHDVKTKLVTTLEDGSIIYLGENTTLKYPEHFSDTKREVSFNGNAYFNIQGNKECPFFIDTEFIEIEIIGTSFFVKNEKNKPFQLSVQSGLVKVKNKKNKDFLYVNPGETVTHSSNQLAIEKTSNSEELELYKRYIRFKDEKLINILHVLNKENPEMLIKSTAELEQKKLNIAFSDSSSENIANLLALALKAKYVKEKSTIFISGQ